MRRGGETARHRSENLRAGQEPRPHRQRTLDAPAAAQSAAEAAQGTSNHEVYIKPILLLKLGAAKGRYRAAWRLFDFVFPKPNTRGLNRFLAFGSIGKSCERSAGAKVAICCAPICARDPANSGSSTSNWWRLKPPSKTSKTICNCGRSTTNANTHRSAYLCRLFGLLPARDSQVAVAACWPLG